MQILIRGQPVMVAKNSLRIDWRQNECSTATFRAIEMAAQTEYVKGEPVEIRDEDDTLIFAGVIDKAAFDHRGEARFHQITVRCWTYLADKRIIARSWQNARAGQVIRDIISDWLSEEG